MVLQTVFSRFYVFPFTLMFCIIRSKFFDLYCIFAVYNKRILCTSLRQSKVSLKSLIEKNMQGSFQLDESKNTIHLNIISIKC